MKFRSAFLPLALLCSFAQPSVAVEPVDVSLVQLIANPKGHDGQIVRVIGFVRLEFEGNAIYLHQEDYRHGISKNGLWIDVSDDIRKKSADYDQKYVLIEGTFSARDKGHMGMFSGSIQKISRFQLWMQGDEQK